MGETIETRTGFIRLRRVTMEDVATIAGVMRDAAQLPRSRGLRMWRWLDGPECDRIIAKRIDLDAFYLAILGDEPVATLRLRFDDVETWGERGNDGLAGYVHSLAIVRRLHGQKLGSSLLDWATEQAVALGRRFLRLDCMIPNPRLCAHYESMGFIPEGIAHFGDHSVQRFERTIQSDGQAAT